MVSDKSLSSIRNTSWSESTATQNNEDMCIVFRVETPHGCLRGRMSSSESSTAPWYNLSAALSAAVNLLSASFSSLSCPQKSVIQWFLTKTALCTFEKGNLNRGGVTYPCSRERGSGSFFGVLFFFSRGVYEWRGLWPAGWEPFSRSPAAIESSTSPPLHLSYAHASPSTALWASLPLSACPWFADVILAFEGEHRGSTVGVSSVDWCVCACVRERRGGGGEREREKEREIEFYISFIAVNVCMYKTYCVCVFFWCVYLYTY
jgi:hypothetical protein